MLVRLSDLLRMSLEGNTVQETTLNREMQFVNGYLDIEKMRFGDRLQITATCKPIRWMGACPPFAAAPGGECDSPWRVASGPREGKSG